MDDWMNGFIRLRRIVGWLRIRDIRIKQSCKKIRNAFFNNLRIRVHSLFLFEFKPSHPVINSTPYRLFNRQHNLAEVFLILKDCVRLFSTGYRQGLVNQNLDLAGRK